LTPVPFPLPRSSGLPLEFGAGELDPLLRSSGLPLEFGAGELDPLLRSSGLPLEFGAGEFDPLLRSSGLPLEFMVAGVFAGAPFVTPKEVEVSDGVQPF
jgi:hypothetical protein